MTDDADDAPDVPERVRVAAERTDAFEPAGDEGYRVRTVELDAVVRPDGVDPTTLAVTVSAPRLAAVVEGEAVPEVVEDGWFETFDRRLDGVDSALSADRDLSPAATLAGEEVLVTATFADADVERGLADAKALVEYVEGTYVQGAVPGYDYGEPLATLRGRARENAQGEPGT